MSLRVVWFEETGEERRVVRRCKICFPGNPTPAGISRVLGVVSPAGIEHHVPGCEKTGCGHDATGSRWWWPL